jgi:hypothetical protein
MLRRLVLAAVLVIGASALVAAADMDVYRSEDCSCCGKWAEHMKKNGFKVRIHNMSPSKLDAIKSEASIADRHASCHTAKIEGYVIEGHVPAEDVKRLLAERPKAIGLAVPGMPIGSPGMEVGKRKEPYEVLLIKEDGSTEVFAKH